MKKMPLLCIRYRFYLLLNTIHKKNDLLQLKKTLKRKKMPSQSNLEPSKDRFVNISYRFDRFPFRISQNSNRTSMKSSANHQIKKITDFNPITN